MNKLLGILIIFGVIFVSIGTHTASAALNMKTQNVVSGETKITPLISKKKVERTFISKIPVKTSTGNTITKNPTASRTGAKIPVKPSQKITGTGSKVLTKYETRDFIDIYELPNYQGKSTRFYKGTETNNIVLPFSSRNMSIKMSNEATTIVFLRKSANDPKNITLISNSGSFFTDSESINFVRVSTKAKLEVVFNGILYGTVNDNPTLRNNDAKRLYGNINYKIYGIEGIGRNSKLTPIVPVDGGTTADGTVYLFQKEKNTDYIAPFIYATSTHPLTHEHTSRRSADNVYGQKFLRTTADLPLARKEFYIDALAYSGRNINSYILKMSVDIKIGSAYKSCDFCTDFTWDAHMLNTVNESFMLPGNTEYVSDRVRRTAENLHITQLGPYRKNSTRQGVEKNFTGPEIPTYIQFTTRIINE